MRSERRPSLTRAFVVAGVPALVAGALFWALLPQPEPYEPVVFPTLTPDVFLDSLHQKYGESRYSRSLEETFIRDFFEDARDGLFVDVGAHHHERENNTFYLEKHLGWSGLAIDAQEEFRAGYEEFRPRTRFFTFFVSDRSDDAIDFFLTPESLHATGSRERAETKERFETRSVVSITLDDLLEREGVETFDLLSMDIELAEPAALAGFDIERFRPRLVCIEMSLPDQLRAYFAQHGYEEIESYSVRDHGNSYFTARSE